MWNPERTLSLKSVKVNPPYYGVERVAFAFGAQGDHNMDTGRGEFYTEEDDDR